jgi:DNA-binding transcriptional MerR regulator
MQDDDLHIEKLYFSISEVAKMFNVNASLIRFWEKEFPVLHPKKNTKGDRLFTKKDIEAIRHIYHLVKERGFTLQGARQTMKEKKPDAVAKPASSDVKDSLLKIKSFLEELKGKI